MDEPANQCNGSPAKQVSQKNEHNKAEPVPDGNPSEFLVFKDFGKYLVQKSLLCAYRCDFIDGFRTEPPYGRLIIGFAILNKEVDRFSVHRYIAYKVNTGG